MKGKKDERKKIETKESKRKNDRIMDRLREGSK